jgi:hypothetical protein
MTLDKLYSVISRIFFFAAFALLCLIGVEKIANIRGFTILLGYSGERVLDLAGVLVVFVIAILLRQIREALLAKSA